MFVYDEAGHSLGDYPPSAKFKGNEFLYLDDLPVAILAGGALSYLETDHLGTPRIAANPTTNAWQWQWSFFGGAFGDSAPTQAVSGGIDVNLRYPGQRFDSETGLNYNYFRDYEAGTGRHMESDPIGLEGGANTYAYVTSRPIREIDLWGLQGAGAFFGCMSNPPPDLFAFAQAQSAQARQTQSREPPNPDQWLPNGNLQPDYQDQDYVCSDQARPLNGTPAESCCRTHDKCYEIYQCNKTSWPGMSNGWSVCGQCNAEAVRCVLNTFGSPSYY